MKIIVGDAGHGGKDPGACGNGLKEADITIDLIERIQTKLAPYDVDFLIGPRSDNLQERADFANQLNADYFLSIHVNAGGGTGFESYVYTDASEESRQLRDVVHDAITSGFLVDQGVVDRGRKQDNFAVLRETNMPAVLLENLFIDNEQDAAKLMDDAFLNGLANEIAWGLVKALGLKRKTPESAPIADDGFSMSGAADKVTIKAGGKTFPGIMQDGKTYGPIRDIVEALGHRVTWFEDDLVAKVD